jgi:hypothetical protein
MNLYGFAGGDPINFSDPMGTCPIVGLAMGPVIGGGTAIWCLAEVALLAGAATSATALAQGQHAEWPYHPRPKFRKGTSDDVETSLEPGGADNTYVCPTCRGTFPTRNPDGTRGYDKDHAGKSWAERLLDLKEAGADRDQVKDEYQKDVRARCPACNRGDNKPPEKKPDAPKT